ncbi:hypothetical protein Tco_0434487 [Tanacetum coccineum]
MCTRLYELTEYELTEEEEENKEGDDKDKEGEQEQDDEDNLYRDVNINMERSDAEMTDAQANKDTKDAHVTLTVVPPIVQQQSSSISSDFVSKFINPSPDTRIDSILNPNIQSHTLVNVLVFVTAETPSSDTTIPPTRIPIIQPLQQKPESTTTILTIAMPDILEFASVFRFDQWVSALETEMSEFKQTNQFSEVVSLIPSIVDNYLASKMKEAVDVVVQLQINKFREEAQVENQEFLNQVDSTMKAITKEHVQAQVSKIMPRTEKYVTKSLGVGVLVRSTNQPQTSYAVATSLSEFELKKILIDKMEENKSINRSDIQKHLYNALVESYNSGKDVISSYDDVVTLKRGRDDQDKDEDPSAGSNRGSKRRRSSKEAESSKEPTHKESKSTSSSKGASRSQPKSSGNSPTPDREWHKTKTADKRPPQPWISQLAQAIGIQSSFNEFLATPIDFHAFIMNWLKIDNLTQENERGRQVIPWDYFINNDLEYLKGGSSSQKYTTFVTKMKVVDYGQVKWIEDKLYKFREGDFKRLRRQDIEDMLLLLVQDKLSNLNIEERYALNMALRMLTRRIVIQERVEDLQLGVESY